MQGHGAVARLHVLGAKPQRDIAAVLHIICRQRAAQRCHHQRLPSHQAAKRGADVDLAIFQANDLARVARHAGQHGDASRCHRRPERASGQGRRWRYVFITTRKVQVHHLHLAQQGPVADGGQVVQGAHTDQRCARGAAPGVVGDGVAERRLPGKLSGRHKLDHGVGQAHSAMLGIAHGADLPGGLRIGDQVHVVVQQLMNIDAHRQVLKGGEQLVVGDQLAVRAGVAVAGLTRQGLHGAGEHHTLAPRFCAGLVEQPHAVVDQLRQHTAGIVRQSHLRQRHGLCHTIDDAGGLARRNVDARDAQLGQRV